MNHTVGGLRLVSLICWSLFGWAIAAELDFLPAIGDDFWWRWQFTLLAGVVCWVTAERLAEFRCRCCGASEVKLRALFTRSRELLCHRCLHWNPLPGHSHPVETRN
jgi:hypothetical protein